MLIVNLNRAYSNILIHVCAGQCTCFLNIVYYSFYYYFLLLGYVIIYFYFYTWLCNYYYCCAGIRKIIMHRCNYINNYLFFTKLVYVVESVTFVGS